MNPEHDTSSADISLDTDFSPKSEIFSSLIRRLGSFSALGGVILSSHLPTLKAQSPEAPSNEKTSSLVHKSSSALNPNLKVPCADTNLIRVISDSHGNFTEQLLFERAAAPDLLQLKGGALLLVFDHVRNPLASGVVTLSIVRSYNRGLSFTAPKSVVVRDRRGDEIKALHADLVEESDGTLRLFFSAKIRHDNSTNSRFGIYSATYKGETDEVTFVLDEELRFPISAKVALHPTTFKLKQTLCLLAADTDPKRKDRCFVIDLEKKRVARCAEPAIEKGIFVGNITSIDDHAVAVLTTPKGLVQARSTDGLEWTIEESSAVAGVWDGALVKVGGKKVLSVECQKRVGVTAPLTDLDFDIDFEAEMPDKGLQDPETVYMPQTEAEDSQDLEFSGALNSESTQNLDNEIVTLDDSFAPNVDFSTPFDYGSWVCETHCQAAPGNAYENYITLLNFIGAAEEDQEGPTILDHFVAEIAPDDKVMPWNPKASASLKDSAEQIEDALRQFKRAASQEGYSTPFNFAEGGSKLLVSLLLPHLSSHRLLAKATLFNAWRQDDNGVSPERLREAWEVCARNAGHLSQGITAIEKLAAAAERNLTARQALKALHHGHIPGESLKESLEVLKRNAHFNSSLEDTLRSEHAVAMELVQYMFSPPGANGEPKANRERAMEIYHMVSPTHLDPEQFLQMTAEQAYASIDAINRFYSDILDQIRIGYPLVKESDFELTGALYANTSPLTAQILPGFGRIYYLLTRSEAMWRGTQVVYAMHLFKDEHKHWPKNLQELSEYLDQTTLIDPFTGEFFEYRLTENGPHLQSLGDNARDDLPLLQQNPHVRIDDALFWPFQEDQ